MGVRETINQKPGIAAGAMAAVILVALGIIVWQLLGTRSSAVSGAGTGKAFYTDDDGKTWFADDATKYAPFDHNGKPAYEASIWTCDGGKTQFCAYLRRYTEDARKKLVESASKTNTGAGDPTLQLALAQGREVKLPGNGDDPKNWVKQTDPAATKVLDVKCKNGGELEPVSPQ